MCVFVLAQFIFVHMLLLLCWIWFFQY